MKLLDSLRKTAPIIPGTDAGLHLKEKDGSGSVVGVASDCRTFEFNLQSGANKKRLDFFEQIH